MLILAAIPFYLFAVAAAWSARRASLAARLSPRVGRTWLALALLFAVMVFVRVADLENLLRDAMRAALLERDAYAARRTVQAMLAALAAIALGMLAWWAARRGDRQACPLAERWRRIAALAGVAYLMLAAVRLVSLHQVDALLYGGMHINRLLDPGLALLAGFAAMRFRAHLAGCHRCRLQPTP